MGRMLREICIFKFGICYRIRFSYFLYYPELESGKKGKSYSVTNFTPLQVHISPENAYLPK